jgi:two-component system, OmpR family, alkaline phosphatase synthesis response regulator PhoP
MTSHDTILIVDDDPHIVSVLRDYLTGAGYGVFFAHDGETALHILRRERPVLMVLDLMLPQRDGWDITRLVRNDSTLNSTLIIMLTARIEDTDKILGLELGADDYITKPFNPREVLARIRTVLRRIKPTETRATALLRCGNISLNDATRAVMVDDRLIHLTPTEFRLLQTLMAHPNFVFTRAELIEKAFGYDYQLDDRILDNHIRNLRKKIEADPNNPLYLMTIYGVGYRLTDEPT